MSERLQKIVIDLIKESKEKLSPDDICSIVKEDPAFQRTQKSALKPNIIKIIDNYTKSLPQKEKENIEIKFLNKKRKEPSNINNNNNLSKKNNPNSSIIDVSKFLYKPSIKLSDLGGMSEIINELREIISNPLYNYQAYKELKIEPIKGLLLCGPPGCGKTTLAYAIGGEFNIPFYKITGPDIITSLSGESEQIIRNLFKTVIKNAPSILFIDEIETILGKREQANKEMERRIVAQIMSCIDEINYIQLTELDNPIFIIGATSKPEFIDNSMRRSGRFDKEIHIGFPSLDMRKDMLISITKDKKISEKLDFNLLAKNTPGYLAADLQSLVRTAGHHAISRLIKDKIDTSKIFLEQVDFDYAISIILPTSKREGFTTIPNVSWNDIGGLKELHEELYYDIVLPCVDPNSLKIVGINKAVGVLLYGPPGCGKTLLAKAVANEAKANFISIKGPELLNKYVGESEKAVRQLFIRARNSSPCIIFFDELDALVPKRQSDSSNSASSERVVNQLLTEMDGLEDRKSIFIIAATNRPDIIDPAMLRPGRLDKLLYVPLPNESDRLSILQTICRGLPINNSEVNINDINNNPKLNGFSGADIAALVREAQLHALKRLRKFEGINEENNNNNNNVNNNLLIGQKDFDYAIENILPSVSVEDRVRYEKLKNKIKESRSHIK